MVISDNDLKIFRIKFHDPIEVLAELYTDIDPVDHLMSSLIETDGCFDFQMSDGTYVSYMIISESNVNNYKNIMGRNGIGIDVEDVSSKVLKNEISLQDDLLPYAKDINVDPYYEFSDSISKWIQDRLTPDDVLDIISEKGVESLKDFHKEILKKL